MNSSENFSFSDSDYYWDYENDDGEGIEKLFLYWIEGVLTPVVSLFGVLGKNIYQVPVPGLIPFPIFLFCLGLGLDLDLARACQMNL